MSDLILKDLLSKKEEKVLSLMKTGMSNREIAAQLEVSVNTIKSHAKNIFKKLKVKNRTQASILNI